MSMHQHIDTIINTLSYSNTFSGSTFLIKLGGSILHDSALIHSLCSDLKLLSLVGVKIILVHGGSFAINQQLLKQNIESEFIDGLRVTSVQAMEVIEMVLCGHVNTSLVRKLNAIGMHAIGLSGANNNMLQCDYYSKQHGCVGTIKKINTEAIHHLILNHKLPYQTIPVIAPIGINVDGKPMNINADYAASSLANALKAGKLIYLTDQDGIYDKNGNIFSELSQDNLLDLINDHTVEGGMLTKTKAILKALNGHLNHVHILNGKKNHVLIEELFTVKGAGTLCKKTSTLLNKLEVVA